MPTEVRKVTNSEFMDLASLWVKMNELLSESIHAPAAMWTLTNDMLRKDFICFGLYIGGVLEGFTAGYALSDKTYYFSGIYVSKLSRDIKGLIERSFAEIKRLGYTRWEVDCNNKNISGIMEKYGAVPMYTRYKKED